jgi:putative lysine transport system substrate-binding protein
VFNEGMGFSEEVPVNIGIAKGHDDVVRKINDILAGISEGERQLFWSTMVQAEPM